MSPELAWHRLGPPSRRPSTVVEWIIGVSITAIILALALPRVSARLDERAAAQVLEQVMEVQQAAQRAAEQGDWAALADAPAGEIPEGLGAYLPEGTSFDSSRWVLDWDLFEIEGSLRRLIVGDRHGAVTVVLQDEGVADAVQRLAGQRLWLRLDNDLSFLVPALGAD